MAVKLVITTTLTEVPALLTKVARDAAKKAVSRSIKRTLQGLRKEVSKVIRARRLVNARSLPVAEIKKRYLRESQNTSQALDIGEMGAQIDISDRRPSLAHFFPKRSRVGGRGKGAPLYRTRVTVMGKTYGTGRAFMSKKRGALVLLARETEKRLPLRKLFGPSFAMMIERSGAINELQASTIGRYKREFQKNFEYYLSQLRMKKP